MTILLLYTNVVIPFCYCYACRNYEQIARSQRHAVSTCMYTEYSDSYMYVPVYQMRLLILMRINFYFCFFPLVPLQPTLNAPQVPDHVKFLVVSGDIGD